MMYILYLLIVLITEVFQADPTAPLSGWVMSCRLSSNMAVNGLYLTSHCTGQPYIEQL